MTSDQPSDWDGLADVAQTVMPAWRRELTAFWGEGDGLGWGWWQHPEDQLWVLGDLTGLGLLDLGCETALGTLKLAGRGARVVGLDLSWRQLVYARRNLAEAERLLPLVQADAHRLPFTDASFDAVGAVSPRRRHPLAWVRDGIARGQHALPAQLRWLDPVVRPQRLAGRGSR